MLKIPSIISDNSVLELCHIHLIHNVNKHFSMRSMPVYISSLYLLFTYLMDQVKFIFDKCLTSTDTTFWSETCIFSIVSQHIYIHRLHWFSFGAWSWDDKKRFISSSQFEHRGLLRMTMYVNSKHHTHVSSAELDVLLQTIYAINIIWERMVSGF